MIGPWSHDWPDVSVPGPNIGFMDECLDFWNHHLKDKPSEKQEKAPKLIWYQCKGSVPPAPSVDVWPGSWCGTKVAKPDMKFNYYLNEGQLLDQQVEKKFISPLIAPNMYNYFNLNICLSICLCNA